MRMTLRQLDERLKQLEPPPPDPRPPLGIRVLGVSPDGEITEIHRFIIPRAPRINATRRFRRR